jgi:CDP-glucose 4,6-dehydratase
MESLEIKDLFGSVYKGKTVLVTGDTGFKGTWLSFWLVQMGAKVIGYSIDDTTTPSHHKLLKQNYKSYRGDINDLKYLQKIINKHKPQIVFHLAAQSLVRRSYHNPVETYTTNVIGTLNVFEAARFSKSVKAIVNVTTDKVYENLEINKAYAESDQLGGYDMYSSSKACVEILSSSYKRSFFCDHKILLATARAGNVIGGGDWAEDRLIPDIVKATSKNEKTVIRNPISIRPWQHVLEPLSGYLLLGQKLLEGKKEFAESWNFGPDTDQCLKVGEVLDLFKRNWPELKVSYPKKVKNNFHEAGVLMLDHSKAKNRMKWKPVWGIETTINKTATWYKTWYDSGKLTTQADLFDYISDAKKKKLIWTK